MSSLTKREAEILRDDLNRLMDEARRVRNAVDDVLDYDAQTVSITVDVSDLAEAVGAVDDDLARLAPEDKLDLVNPFPGAARKG